MSRFSYRLARAGFLLLLFSTTHLARSAVILSFEGFPDGTILTNQYPGVTFSNAIILTAGISLNEFEFPPHSGVNVASDNGGPMALTFASMVASFGGYFTYAVPLTIDAYGSTGSLVAAAASAFSDNEALSGEPGSSPNEFLQVSFAGGISSVIITGDPGGASFALDDATFNSAAAVPEPSSLTLTLTAMLILVPFLLNNVRRSKSKLKRQRALSPAAVRVPACSFLSLLCAASAFPATHSIGVVAVTPITAVIGTSTPFTVTASITDPALISNSVNLLQLNGNGSTTVLGTLHDDGLNGDAFAGDLVFTLVVPLNASAASDIELQVSAAFTGALLRVKSPILNIFFQPANAPQQAITALAQYLAAGNTAAALNYVVPSVNTTSALNALSQQGLSALAAMLSSAQLVGSQNNLRIFQSLIATPDGAKTTVELTMVPGPNGQWLVNNW